MTIEELKKHFQNLYAFEQALSIHAEKTGADEFCSDKTFDNCIQAQNVVYECIIKLNDLGFMC